jgi:hypothetical protein
MCEPTTIAAIGAGMQVLSSVQQGQAKEEQANYEAGVARNNQITAGYAADDALRRGELEAQRVQRQASQLTGTQRASYAAKGMDITEGTPGDVIDQTNFFGQVDANTARYNGKVEAWQKKTQAQNFGAQADAASSRASGAMAGSLLSGAGSVASSWYAYGGANKAPTPVPWYAGTRGMGD